MALQIIKAFSLYEEAQIRSAMTSYGSRSNYHDTSKVGEIFKMLKSYKVEDTGSQDLMCIINFLGLGGALSNILTEHKFDEGKYKEEIDLLNGVNTKSSTSESKVELFSRSVEKIQQSILDQKAKIKSAQWMIKAYELELRVAKGQVKDSDTIKKTIADYKQAAKEEKVKDTTIR